MNRIHMHTVLAAAVTTLACAAPAAVAGHRAHGFGPWGDPQMLPPAVDTAAAAEGCPIESPDGRELYIASNRSAPGAQGKLDIYRSRRGKGRFGDWGTPQNLGTPVNSTEFDYCPTPLVGRWLMFVSSRAHADDCVPGDAPPPAPPGGPAPGDIYLSWEFRPGHWIAPLHLGCAPNGPNTAGAEFSPSLVHTAAGTFLYFSSNGYDDSQGQDIYASRVLRDGTVLPGKRVAELSTAADDRMPNVRRDGLEIVFSSNRAGATPFDQDIYVATRRSVRAPWSAPVRIADPDINTPGSETRASLSGDGTRLYFGRKLTAADPGDVYVSTRRRHP
ncbi:PD40 domain-containing protein [Luteimonas mephitis]|uniref:PD40 domain-containing protein n=1 Tax=Luteimonas mephitis TaxID=83615 RepID=UPI00040E76FC|nr:PD40 domain-containing protein [Luteimonas mephitis]